MPPLSEFPGTNFHEPSPTIIWIGAEDALPQFLSDSLNKAFGKQRHNVHMVRDPSSLENGKPLDPGTIIITDNSDGLKLDQKIPGTPVLLKESLALGNTDLLLRFAYENSCLRRLVNGTDMPADLAGLHKIQEQLEEERNYLREIGQYAKIGGWRYLIDGDKTWLSDTVFDIYGVSKDKPFKVEKGITFFKGEAQKQILGSFNKLLKDGTSYDLILAFRNARDEDLWVRTRGIPIYQNGDIIGAWGVMQDVTDLFFLKSEHDFIQTCSSELHIVIKNDIIQEMNDRWPSVFGYEKSEVILQDWTQFLHPEDQYLAPKLVEMIYSRKYLENIELRGLHKDGHTVYLTFNARLAPDNETIFAIARDISDVKEREMQLEKALEKVNAANEAKNQFLMMMSHELRTPLNPILGFTDLLLMEVKDKDQKELLQIVKDSARHLASLVSDILDISGIETGKIFLDEKAFNIAEVTQSVVGMMMDNARARGLSLSLDMKDAEKGKNSFACVGDENKVRQILLNVLNNALKFTHEGKVTVTLPRPQVRKNVVLVTIRITDTGIGIPASELEKIFEKFHQVQMSETRSYQGQGLGLSLSREFARLMGGDILVQSTPGKGSTFTIKLQFRSETE